MVGREPLILMIYVDDLFFTRSPRLTEDYMRDLAENSKMKDLGLMRYFLGLDLGLWVLNVSVWTNSIKRE